MSGNSFCAAIPRVSKRIHSLKICRFLWCNAANSSRILTSLFVRRSVPHISFDFEETPVLVTSVCSRPGVDRVSCLVEIGDC